MKLGLDDKVVLVTGGAGGIGAAISRSFAQEGSRIAITYRTNEQDARALVQELNHDQAEAIALPYDMGDLQQAEQLVDAIITKWGRLDVVIANAVQWPSMPKGQERLIDNDMETWTHAVRKNFEGTTALLRRAAQEMAKNDYGRIVIIHTEIAEVGMAGSTAYSAAKAGVRGLVMSLCWEVGPNGVLINLVSPGFNMTPRNLARVPEEIREQVRRRTPTGKLSSPEDVAPLVVFLASEANRNMTGEFISANGGAVF